ncbi:MAG: AarF/ABC1/UbiB kinase family protein [Myxococcota bacterium]
MSDRPATKGRRLFKLASMTAKVAGGYAKNRVKSVFQGKEATEQDRVDMYEKSGEVIAKTLGELKGAVMKVGQMASVAADVLPKEVQDALTSLQREAPPMPYDVIAEQIESEFSALPETLFRSFERVPFASASIGQVHRAVTDDGREVVVKVQYPGVDGAVDSDLAHLKLALRASGLVRVPKKTLDAVFGELKARLHEELDYCNEADNVRFFCEHYKDTDGVVVPEVVGERSSQRVLTLTYEPGDHLDEARSYPQDVRDTIANHLFDVVAEQAFDLQVIHADPNPANFAFRPDGTLVLYDFGCVKRLDPGIIDAYLFTVRASLEERYEDVEQGMIRLGARNLEGTPVPPEYYKVWRDIFSKPFQGEPFDFSEAQLQREAMKHVPGFMAKYLTSFQPPPELVFLDRVVVGHYGTLRRLGARANYRDRLYGYLERAPTSVQA